MMNDLCIDMAMNRSPKSFRAGFRKRAVLFRWFLFLLAGKMVLGCASSVPSAMETAGKEGEPNIRVCLVENLAAATLGFEGAYILELEEARYQLDKSIGTLNASFRGTDLILKNDRRYYELSAPQTVVFKPSASGDRFIFNDIPYAGELWFQVEEGGVTVVNKLPVETYLLGVVPFEIPTNQHEYQEAIYAQAIAARTYAIYRLQNPINSRYDIYSDVQDQVYQGMLKKAPLAEDAITATRGIILANSSRVDKIFFHSTCGGVVEATPDTLTAASAGSGTFAYDLSDNDYNCKVSPYYRWVEVRTLETILWNLQKEFRLDSLLVRDWLETGCKLDIQIAKRRQSGRIEEMVMRVEDQLFPVSGFRIRRVLADQTGKVLPSNFFFFTESPGSWEKLYLIGAGAGHGEGMCQWGAIGLALKGNSYKSILGFYYPNLSMVKFY